MLYEGGIINFIISLTYSILNAMTKCTRVKIISIKNYDIFRNSNFLFVLLLLFAPKK